MKKTLHTLILILVFVGAMVLGYAGLYKSKQSQMRKRQEEINDKLNSIEPLSNKQITGKSH